MVTTPFVIRMLGTEGYGVLVLVVLIPTYVAFADFGMNLASKKFGSEVYAVGDYVQEGRVVRTSAMIALLASLPVGIIIFAFSFKIVNLFNVPPNLVSQASIALKLLSITLVVNFLNNILNTPQIVRLRMDSTTLVTTGFRVFGIIATPVVLYVGGGIVGAASIVLCMGILTLITHIIVSRRLLSHLMESTIDWSLVRPLIYFGGPMIIAGIAGTLLINLEKIILTRVTSVETLAYYSVAFTFGTMAILFSAAMVQSLIPAFSQLLKEENRYHFDLLFSRTFRIDFLLLIPMVVVLFIAGKPLFTLWAGEDFGRESTPAFYVLLIGLSLNIIAHVPYSVLIASGRTDIIAKIYWIQLLPYIFAVAFLTSRFGAVGAATAWTLRVFADTAMIVWLAHRSAGVSFNFITRNVSRFCLLILAGLPLIVAVILGVEPIWFLFALPIFIAVYFLTVWKIFLAPEERIWISGKFKITFNR